MWIYLCTFVVLLITWWVWAYRRPSNFPSGPFVWPFVHNLTSLSLDGKLRQSLDTLHTKYGPIFSLSLGSGFWDVFVQGPDLVREVLHDPRFTGRALFSHFKSLDDVDNGMTFANGEGWRSRKKAFLQILRTLGVGKSQFVEGIEMEVVKFLDHLPQEFSKPFNFRVGFRIFFVEFSKHFSSNSEFAELTSFSAYVWSTR